MLQIVVISYGMGGKCLCCMPCHLNVSYLLSLSILLISVAGSNYNTWPCFLLFLHVSAPLPNGSKILVCMEDPDDEFFCS